MKELEGRNEMALCCVVVHNITVIHTDDVFLIKVVQASDGIYNIMWTCSVLLSIM